MAYDAEELDKFLFDNKADKTGLEYACHMINAEINELLNGKVIQTMDIIDDILMMFYHKKVDNQQDIGINVIRVCSEAILMAASTCFQSNSLFTGIN